MKNNIKKPLLIGLAFSVIVFGLIFIIMLGYSNAEIYIFEDISECLAIENIHNEGSSFERYQDTTRDSHISDISYISFFAGEYTCDEFGFEIFAYEFSDNHSAAMYFERVSKKDSAQKNPNFSLSSGVIQSRIVVISDSKAYAVYCPTKDLSDVLKVLEDTFATNISKTGDKTGDGSVS